MYGTLFVIFSFPQTESTEEVESLINIGPNVRLMVLKNNVNLSFPVAQLCSSILELEIVKTIIQIETDEDQIITKLRDAKEIKKRVKLK